MEALRVRSLEVARQRQGRHVLLQGFCHIWPSTTLLFLQVNHILHSAQSST